jgi:formylglycine-generating enzyme required for sulfatase activity
MNAYKNIVNYTLVLMLLAGASAVQANNISVSNITLTGRDVSAGTNNSANFSLVQFNISWENSWRRSSVQSNWDAAWVFVKYRRAGGTWQHAWLNNTGHTAPSGSTIDVGLLTPGSAFNASTNPGLGAFIYRSAAGAGNNTFNSVQLRWNYGAQSIPDTAVVELSVFAVEMVYVPQGSFYVGSGSTESGSFTDGSWSSGATIPFQITSEAALGIDNAAGKLWGTSTSGNTSIGNIAADPEATLSASYPKGYAAIYCMKYEISQGQYRDFLNALTYVQQTSLSAAAPSSAPGTAALSNTNRNGLDIQISGNATSLTPAVYACNLDGDGSYDEAEDGIWIACNFLSWMDGCAYLDWSGLRPITELEFEKVCRGNQTPVAAENAWGNSSATAVTSISNDGFINETSSNTNANTNYNNTLTGPMRVGALANASSTRISTGATYYGIMEMSSNLPEHTVSLGNEAGRSFTGIHGDGILLSDGFSNVDFWPGINGNSTTSVANAAFGGTTGVTQAAGSGYRGGGFASDLNRLRTSARHGSGLTSINRGSPDGIRGVRSAP